MCFWKNYDIEFFGKTSLLLNAEDQVELQIYFLREYTYISD